MCIRTSRLGATSLLLGLTALCHVSLFWRETVPAATGQNAAQTPKSVAVDEKTIRGLIAQLGDDSFDKREAAQKSLADIGLPAFDLLRNAATEAADLEVRERAGKLVKEINHLRFTGRAILFGSVIA
jgi:hypothetical protein